MVKFMCYYKDFTPATASKHSDMLFFMCNAHHVFDLVRSPFFRNINIGDGKYTLTIVKCISTEKLSITFSKDPRGSQVFNNHLKN